MDKDEMLKRLGEMYDHAQNDEYLPSGGYFRLETTHQAISDHLKRCKCGEPDEEYLYGHFSHDGDTLIQDRKKV